MNICFYLFICVYLFLYGNCSEEFEKLCANNDCTEPISKARGAVQYIRNQKDTLSFQRGKEITIISKPKSGNGLWGAIIDGQSGYVPSNLVKETRIYHPTDKLMLVVPKLPSKANLSGVEQAANPLNVNIDSSPAPEEQAQKKTDFVPEDNRKQFNFGEGGNFQNTIQKSSQSDIHINPSISYDVIEGTTLVADIGHDITPSVTEEIKANQQTLSPFTVDINKDLREIKGKNDEIQYREGVDNIPNISDNIIKEGNSISFSKNAENKGKNDDIRVGDLKGDADDGKKKAEEQEEDGVDYYGEGGDDAGDDDDDDDEEEDEEEEEEEEGNGGSDSVATDKSSHVPITDSHSEKAVVGEERKNINISMNKDLTNVSFNADNSQGFGNTEKSDTDGSIKNHSSEETMKDTINPVDGGNVHFDIHKITEELPGKSKEEHLEHTTTNHFINPSLENKVTTEKNNEKIDLKPEQNGNDVATQQVFETKPPLSLFSFNNEMNAQVKSSEPEVGILNTDMVQNSVPGFWKPDNKDEHELGLEKVFDGSKNMEPVQSVHQLNAPELKLSEDSFAAKSQEASNPIEANSYEQMGKGNENLDSGSVPLQQMEHNNNLHSSESLPEIVLNDMKPSEFDAVTELPNEGAFKSSDLVVETSPGSESNEQENNEIQPPLEYDTSNDNEETNSKVDITSFLQEFPNVVMGWLGLGKTPDEGNIDSNTEEALSKIDDYEGTKEDNVGILFSDSSDKDGSRLESAQSLPNSGTEDSTYWSLDNLPASSNTFLYLVVTAITVLLFTLGHNFIEKKGKSGPLIAKINKLEQELFVTTKECLLLKDEIQSARDKIKLYENSQNDELIVSLRAEVEEAKKTRLELESSIEVLQQELDSATEAGLDLNKMLSEVLTQKGGSESLLKSVENLQTQLNSQQEIINEMTEKLGVKNEENEVLQSALEGANEKVEHLDEQLNDAKSNLEVLLKDKETITQDLKTQIHQLQIRINQVSESKEKEVSKLKENVEELEKKLLETGNALSVKEDECKNIKISIKKLKTKGGNSWESLFDASKAKAELAKAETDNKALSEELEKQKTTVKTLENNVTSLEGEVEKLKSESEEAKEKEEEAQKKLEVLSKYFKEKETQLQKELGFQETLWAQKKGDEKAVYNLMKSLQEEVDSYKSQNETLKKEIFDQERSLKNQIAGLEQKAHENWVAARQAERKLEENKQETAQLRNRLTLIEKNTTCNDSDGKVNTRAEDLNGGEPPTSPILHDTSSPLLFPPLPLDPNSSPLLPHGFMPHPMFMPPPMGGFIPPPPFLPGDRRPPPLGRMSSPPLNSRFSPPPPEFSYDHMASPPVSPHGRTYRSPNEIDRDREQYRHRNTPPYSLHTRNWDEGHDSSGFIPISSQKDTKREHKGSNVSSGHSSSDSLDQSTRHSVRV